jgi:hypothetical protein
MQTLPGPQLVLVALTHPLPKPQSHLAFVLLSTVVPHPETHGKSPYEHASSVPINRIHQLDNIIRFAGSDTVGLTS